MKILIDYKQVRGCYNIEEKIIEFVKKEELEKVGFFEEDIEKITSLKINYEVVIEDICGIIKIKRIA